MIRIKHLLTIPIIATTIACSNTNGYKSYEEYPSFQGEWTEMSYSPQSTSFMVWAPTAEAVKVNLFDEGIDSDVVSSVDMKKADNGKWEAEIKEDLNGKFYTFNVRINGKWLGDTPGVIAKAVGVNGKRAAIINLDSTDPEGWENDKRPELKSFNCILIYNYNFV
ncbi:MAG: hypothetical protein SOX26_07850 [Phocaeicola sp.]|nr:hypothetical protein [Phocaeicola sp.]